jgi:prephenate dehydratase
VIGEVELRIRHCLIAIPGAEIGDVRVVMSHPVALAQCRRFLQLHSQMKKVVAEDTAGSVRDVMSKGLRDHAAIAGIHAAKVYGAAVLAEGIEDHPENFTRFLLLSPVDVGGEDGDKTSVVFSLSNKPGSLFRALAALALRDIDLIKIESRPIEGQVWEYRFYIDFLGSTSEVRVQNALSHLRELSPDLRVLGCYKRAERPEV